MNVENLSTVFESFKNDKNRAILVDGPWGVGKTYQILQFLKKDPIKNNKKDANIIYVSLFGKTTIDEIHTEIYSKLYPVKNGAKKIIKVIPKVAPLFGNAGNVIANMEFALKVDESIVSTLGRNIQKASEKFEKTANNINSKSNSKVKMKKPKNGTIVIFDDLERIDFQKMPFADILGYINNLFLQNIKVIVICNSKEITDKHFIPFKEKVFDREYKISSTKKEIINSYFGEYSIYLKDYIIKEFDNNLRLALRVSNFYRDVINQLNIYNEKYFEKISNETILYYCTLIIVGCNSQRYAENQEKPNTKSHLMFAEIDDDNVQKIAQTICDYLSNNEYRTNINETLIFGLLEGYYHNVYDKLYPLFVEKEKCENPFLEDPFCLSDEGKSELFTKQFEKIKNDSEISDRVITNVILKMCQYEELSGLNKREDEIIENIIKKCDESAIRFFADYPWDKCERFSEFIRKIKNSFEQDQIKIMVNSINNLYTSRKYAQLYDCLYELERNAIFNKNKILNDDILNIIKSNNYFVENLFGTIELAQWEVAHKICEIAVYFDFAKDIVTYINSINYKEDKSATERYDFLLKKKLFVERQ